MRKIFLHIIGLLILTSVMSACMDDDALRDFTRLHQNNKEGVFIINEGNFNNSNASLSFYQRDKKTVENNVFYNTNALPLGDIAQSMNIQDSLAYIVINNSGKIYIFNKNTFQYSGKITDLSSPRYIHFVNKSKAYVSDLYNKAITIIDPLSQTIIGYIPLDNHQEDFYQHSTEQMLQLDNKVYVNCWSYDDKILVINSLTDKLEDSISVGKQPNSMIIDQNYRLWVLSDGGFKGSSFGQEKASLSCINLRNLKIEKQFIFDDIDASPSHLQTNITKDSLFFIYGNWSGNLANSGIWAMSIYDQTLPQKALIPQSDAMFYSLALDKKNSELYISDAKDFSQNGNVYRYSCKGNIIDTFKVGINPGNFYFMYEE